MTAKQFALSASMMTREQSSVSILFFFFSVVSVGLLKDRSR